ncbi:MAG: aldehyde dehydrogenase family protein [Acidimicrobiales bacterium]|nr:aldehyde dehydrogenase family protein [Acidimicrobiales bacterium]
MQLVEISPGAHLIGGEWISAGKAMGTSINPARPTEPVGEHPVGDASTAADGVSAACDAQKPWRALGYKRRAEILEQAAVLFEERADELAMIGTLEEGKTLAEMRGEAMLSAETCRYQAAIIKMPTERVYPSAKPGETIRTLRAPLGVVGVVTPWNFPILIPVWKIAPALAAGNSVVWKTASNTPLVSVAVARVFHDAGLPPGVLNLILGPGSMGGAMVADPRVDGVTFTGSVPVGFGIRDTVSARNGRVQLELGGHNPAIVFDDADLDVAVPLIVAGAMGSTGQKCTATRRIIAVGSVYNELVDRLSHAVSALSVGDGLDPDVAIGPIVAPRARAEVAEALAKAVAQGAEVVAAASIPDTSECFFAPTLLTGSPQLDIWTEEVFGPISTVVRVDTDDEAFAMANNTDFGLSASVFTTDLWRVDRAVNTLEAGIIKINASTTGSELQVPFGGEKQSSGHAPRERGDTAHDFHTRTRSVYINPGTPNPYG